VRQEDRRVSEPQHPVVPLTPYVYGGIIGVYTGRELLASIMAPLSREIGLSTFQVGLILSTSALTIILISPFWGRKVTGWGHRRVLISSVFGASFGLLGFAVVAHLGLLGILPAAVTFALALLLRGVLYGAASAATPIATQSYVVAVTTDRRSRVRAFAMIGASFGIAGVVGPSLGGLLALQGLLVPLYVPPVLLAAIGGLLWFKLRVPTPVIVTPDVESGRLSPLDPRIRSFLAIGFVLFSTLSIQGVLLGFVLQDRLGLSAEATARLSGIAFLASGVASLVGQVFFVRRLAWPPAWLLRCGLPLVLTGFVVLAFAGNFGVIVGATALVGFGYAFAIPGYSAGPTLLVRDHEQGGVAGLTNAFNGVASIVGPTAATALYGVRAAAPYLVGALLLAAAWAVASSKRLPVR
jgi:MFS transporter, DHA1 family, tetracycline resistance protein